MIKITVRKEKDLITGISVKGHSGYAEAGSDIVCSAVSALTINAVNSVEKLTPDTIRYKESDGELEAYIDGKPGPETELLLQSLLLGLRSIAEQYPRYVKVTD